jgi:hypothetical protein
VIIYEDEKSNGGVGTGHNAVTGILFRGNCVVKSIDIFLGFAIQAAD